MTIAEQAGEQAPDQGLLSDDDLGDLALNRPQGGGGGIVAMVALIIIWFHLVTLPLGHDMQSLVRDRDAA